jgi:hypothetical protein
VASPKNPTFPDLPTWLVVLSGIATVQITGEPAGTEYTVQVYPDVTGAINWAINNYGAPQPAGDVLLLNLEQWTGYAAVGSTSVSALGTTDGGFSVRAWRPVPFRTVVDLKGNKITQIFQGFLIGITTGQSGGPITYRLPYNFTLLAQISPYGD